MAPIATATPPASTDSPRPSKVSKTSKSNGSSNSNAAPPLINLYAGSESSNQSQSQDHSLKQQIIDGLKGTPTSIVPGSVERKEDLEFVYKRTLPTTILYDEQGLLIYDKLVNVPEYYLWKAELSILEKHSTEIALRIFGHVTPETTELLRQARGEESFKREQRKQDHRQDREDQDAPVINGLRPDLYQSAKEKWGDGRVGKFNGGVNGEHGLDSDEAGAMNATSVAPAISSIVGDGGGMGGGGGTAAAGLPSALIELGAGSLRKTIHLLKGLAELPKEAGKTDYYALDLDKTELERTLHDLRSQLQTKQDDPEGWNILGGRVGIHGMWATYDQGLEYLGQPGNPLTSQTNKRCLLWLGSSIGNFERRDAAEFLAKTFEEALRPGDTMLIGIDRRNAARDVELAYNDPQGVTNAFILNGLKHADRILGGQGILDVNKFEYHDRYNAFEGRHESYYRSKIAQTLNLPDGSVVELEEGELIHVERSYKYSERETLDVFDHAGLRVIQRWTNDDEEISPRNGSSQQGRPQYDLWLVEKPAVHFKSTRLLTGWRNELAKGLSVAQAHNTNGSHEYDADGGTGALSLGSAKTNGGGLQPVPHNLWGSLGLPSALEWENVWKSWDTITLTMVSRQMLHQKPIDLRHIVLFYLGHIPTFVDILLLKALPKEEGWKPISEYYNQIFERGIDPHVEDPSQVTHSHSEVPTKEEDWPSVEEILVYREAIQRRVSDLYEEFASGKRVLGRRLARALRMAVEHVELHQETLLYMLAQSTNTLPPMGFSMPDWVSLARIWDRQDAQQGGLAAREGLLHFKADSIAIGHDDDDRLDLDYKVTKPTSSIVEMNRQLGNPEFGWDNESPVEVVSTKAFSITAAPISNEQYLAYLEETGRIKDASHVPSSWIQAPASSPYGPFNVKTVYGPLPFPIAHLWPVQASQHQLATYAAWKGGRLPTHAELRRFMDSSSSRSCTDRPGSNVGFRHWHPIPSIVSPPDEDPLSLPGHNGGVWEHTSTLFLAHPGFEISILYPGYSADFFDGKHMVVLGGSWATTPGIAGRASVKNAYFDTYPYVFAGGRVVYEGVRRQSSGSTSS